MAFGAAFIAGAINSVAGGGTLLTFPTLIWLGLPSINANATSTVAIWPGTVGTIWGYRQDLSSSRPRMFALVAPSVIGGILGALLLNRTPPAVFDALVPFLILFATVLFMIQDPIQKRLKLSHPESHKSTSWLIGAMSFQLFVALYGGYFGAGIGILMLAALTLAGMPVRHAGATKNVLAGVMNATAVVVFLVSAQVRWVAAAIACVGALLGSVIGAHLVQRVNERLLRVCIIVIGVLLTIGLALRSAHVA